jgi:hypothetical protein
MMEVAEFLLARAHGRRQIFFFQQGKGRVVNQIFNKLTFMSPQNIQLRRVTPFEFFFCEYLIHFRLSFNPDFP